MDLLSVLAVNEGRTLPERAGGAARSRHCGRPLPVARLMGVLANGRFRDRICDRKEGSALATERQPRLRGDRLIIDLRDSADLIRPEFIEQGPRGGLASVSRRLLAAKRTVDVFGATLALVVFAPLLVAAAIAIKLTSRGPVLHRQVRIGESGTPFVLLKLRSMRIDGPANDELSESDEADGPVFKIRRDPRTTRVGRFLRRSSIDELPQLLHVLSGRMSLVGPRPPLPNEAGTYNARQRRRLSVRPGMTGIWQVRGRSDLDFDAWIDFDLEYIDTWSLWLDAKLLLMTVPAVLSGRGAY